MGYGNAKALTISYVINQVLAAFGSTIIPYAIAAKAMANPVSYTHLSARNLPSFFSNSCVTPEISIS